MKRLLSIVIISLLLLVTLLSSGCQFTPDDVEDVIQDVMTNSPKTQLGIPYGLRIEEEYLYWNPVEYASRYTVSIDGKEYYANETSYPIGNLSDGEHIFKVKANGDGQTYESSPFSSEISLTLSDGKKAEEGYYSQFEDLTKGESFLGYGFDVINSSMFYDKVVKTSFPIFNHEDLMNQRLLKVDSKSSTVQEIQNSDMSKFMQDWNASANVDVSWGKKKIGGSVSVAAAYSGGSETAKSSYFHAISIMNQKYYIVMQSDINTYREILSDGFKRDLYSDMSPAELFRKYGTHFITSAVMGGRINSYYLYTSEKESSFHDVSSAVSVEVRYLVGKTSVDIGGGYHQTAAQQSISVRNTLEVIGGSDFGMLSDADIGANYAAWEKSLDNHASLMGIKDTGSLCPIWDLIDPALDSEEKYEWVDEQGISQTGTRSQQLQGYFLKYGVDAYNELMEATGLPEIIVPEEITEIKINGKNQNPSTLEYEVFAGTSNPISFLVKPDTATGYTKTAALTEANSYLSISSEDGLSIVVSPDAPHNTVCTVSVAAGNVRKTINIRVIRRFNVNFVSNGGSLSYDTENYRNIVYGSQIPEPDAPQKTGYVFAGWYTDPNFSADSKYQFGAQAVTSHLTLYAKWDEISYTISFVHNAEGSDLKETFVKYNTVYTRPSDPVLDGHAFIGWFSDSAMTQPYDFTQVITNHTTIYVKWQINQYTIAFDATGGSAVPPQTVKHGDYITKPSTVKEGYTFIGWCTDVACQTLFDFSQNKAEGDMTLYAKWLEGPVEMIEVRFDSNGGGVLDSLLVEKGAALGSDLPKPSKEGYTFAGWYFENTYTTPVFSTTTCDASVVLYAKWSINSYTVTFDAKGGSLVSDITVEFNSMITAPITTKKAYTFLGWYRDEANTFPFDFTRDRVTENMTLYAGWQVNNYTITYHSNGGNFSGGTTKYTIETGSIFIPNPSYATYPEYNHFLGWYEDETLTVPFNNDLKTNPRTVHLYAKWDLCTVYSSIDSTPFNLSGRVILDWSKETDTNLLNHTERIVTGERYNNIDIYPGTLSNGVNTEIIFIGASEKVYENLRLYFVMFEDDDSAVIRLVNFKFKSNTTNAMDPHESGAFTLTIDAMGDCLIETKTAGGKAISLPDADISVVGTGILTIQGASGENATTAGGMGQAGGVALSAKNLTVNMTGAGSAFNANGGNGGNGMNGDGGSNGNDGADTTNSACNNNSATDGENGATGQNGGNGGNGADAICLSGKFVIENGTVMLIGGQGGNGGNGGNGGSSSRTEGGWESNSGKAGCSGNGGDAGLAGKYVLKPIYYDEQAPETKAEILSKRMGLNGTFGLRGTPGKYDALSSGSNVVVSQNYGVDGAPASAITQTHIERLSE